MKLMALLAIYWQLTAVSYAENEKQYLNTWVAKIYGGALVASQVAKKEGFSYKGPVLGFENYYVLIKEDLPEVLNWPNVEITQRLMSFPEIKWAEQEEILKVSIRYATNEKKDEEKIPPINTQKENPVDGYSKQPPFNDPMWNMQWYMNGNGGINLNLGPVYEQNITGKNVVIAVLDTGVAKNQPDLEDNFLANESYDFILQKNGSEPVNTSGRAYSHGTMSAGVIAMVANNDVGGIGVAYNSKIIGVRVIIENERIEDTKLAQALNYKLDKVDIYSNSWSHSANGTIIQRVTTLASKALKIGAEKGRKGKGSIYVFSVGNDKHKYDNCASKAYVNNVYTIPIASASRKGKTMYFSERCAAIFGAAPSGEGDHNIVSTAISNTTNFGHTQQFGGNSASAAMASGVIALALEVNPNLTNRDVMHLITMSSDVTHLKDNKGSWYKNAKGFWVSNDFGFGLLNAGNMVKLAKNWKNVPKEQVCMRFLKTRLSVYAGKTNRIKIEVNIDSCMNEINFLEQLEVTPNIECSRRGALNLAITSPSGTRTVLLETRRNDKTETLNNISIRSLHTWGEDPNGVWTLEVRVDPSVSLNTREYLFGIIREVKLMFLGTSTAPHHYATLPRIY